MEQQAGDRVKKPLKHLLHLAAAGDDEAAQELAPRLIDLELDRRLYLRHNNPGYSSVSSTVNLGMPIHHCGCTQSKEPRGASTSTHWHDLAKHVMSELAPRDYLAALVWAAKDHHQNEGIWAHTYDDIAKNLSTYMHALGIPGVVGLKIHYVNGRAIREAALKARKRLVQLVKESSKIPVDA